MTKHIVRYILSSGLLILVWLHIHWSAALVLTLLTIESEISAYIFVKNVKGVYLEKR